MLGIVVNQPVEWTGIFGDFLFLLDFPEKKLALNSSTFFFVG